MLFVQLSLKRWDGYFAVVENAGCQRGVGFPERQHIGDVPYDPAPPEAMTGIDNRSDSRA